MSAAVMRELTIFLHSTFCKFTLKYISFSNIIPFSLFLHKYSKTQTQIQTQTQTQRRHSPFLVNPHVNLQKYTIPCSFPCNSQCANPVLNFLGTASLTSLYHFRYNVSPSGHTLDGFEFALRSLLQT